MAKRESKKIVAGVTEEQYLEALGIYAHSDARAEKLVAQMNIEVTKVREKYDPELTNLMNAKEEQCKVIQAYCTENKDVLFADKRSMETAHARVGFRLGTPKLKTLPKWTWDKVLDKLEAILPEYVRVKKEVNKDALLDARANEQVAPHLNAIGVYVDQDETFYIELKKEEVAA